MMTPDKQSAHAGPELAEEARYPTLAGLEDMVNAALMACDEHKFSATLRATEYAKRLHAALLEGPARQCSDNSSISGKTTT